MQCKYVTGLDCLAVDCQDGRKGEEAEAAAFQKGAVQNRVV